MMDRVVTGTGRVTVKLVFDKPAPEHSNKPTTTTLDLPCPLTHLIEQFCLNLASK